MLTQKQKDIQEKAKSIIEQNQDYESFLAFCKEAKLCHHCGELIKCNESDTCHHCNGKLEGSNLPDLGIGAV